MVCWSRCGNPSLGPTGERPYRCSVGLEERGAGIATVITSTAMGSWMEKEKLSQPKAAGASSQPRAHAPRAQASRKGTSCRAGQPSAGKPAEGARHAQSGPPRGGCPRSASAAPLAPVTGLCVAARRERKPALRTRVGLGSQGRGAAAGRGGEAGSKGHLPRVRWKPGGWRADPRPGTFL